MSTKKVFFVIPSLSSGGAERVMASLANEMAENGTDVSILLTKAQTVKYAVNPMVKILPPPADTSARGQIRCLRKTIRENRTATFISFLTYQNLYLLAANLGLGAKVIVSERNDPAMTLYGRKFLEPVRAALYRTASRIVFQTEDARDYFPAAVRRKGTLICNPLRQDLPEIWEGQREKEIVAVARLAQQKNLPMMLEGCCRILQEYPEYRFTLYGESDPRFPDMKPALEQIAQEHAVSDRVCFAGFVSDVTQRIQKSAVYVSTSDYEGISNSMLEALAMGIPGVCTDCPIGGARMFVKDGVNGYLVPLRDTDAFAAALGQAIMHEQLHNTAAQSAVRLRRELEGREIARQWMELL